MSQANNNGDRGPTVVASKTSKLVAGLIGWLVENPWKSLLGLLALSALSLWVGLGLDIRTNMEDLFPDHTPHVVRAREVREKLGFSSQVKFIIGSPDRDANIRFATDLADRIAGMPDINRVELRTDISFFEKNALLFLDMEELEKLKDRVKRSVKKAVRDELDAPSADAAGAAPTQEELADEEDLDEDFGDGADKAAPSPAPPSGGVLAEDEKAVEDEIPTEEELKETYGLDRFSEYSIAKDGSFISFKVYPSISPNRLAESKEMLGRFEATIKELNPSSYHPDMEWAMEGDYHKKIEEMGVIKRDLTNSSLLSGALVILLLVVFFGNLRTILFVLVPLCVGIVWTMAFTELTIGYLNLMTAFIISILFGLGVDFAIHGVSRYMEERTHGVPVPEALARGLSKLGKPMTAAAMTTSVTFFSLALFDFRGFSQFGVIAGVGVLVCMVALVLVLPPLVVLVNRYVPERPIAFGTRLGALPFFSRSRRGAGWTLAITIAMLLLLTVGLKDLVLMDPDMSKVMTKTKATTTDFIKQYRAKVERQSMSPIIFPTGSLEETRKLHRHLEATWVKGDQANPLNRLEAFHSIWSFIPDDQAPKVAKVSEIREIIRKKLGAMSPEDKDKAEKALKYLSPDQFSANDLPDWLRARFTDTNGELGTYLLAFAKGRKEDAREVGQIVAQLDKLTVDGKDYYSTASYYIMFDAFEMVKKEGPIAMGLAGLMVLLVLLLDFRSPRKALWVFAPLPLGVAGFLGLCGINGWNINILNMVVLPTLIGIGIDTSLHLYHRGMDLRREQACGESKDTMGLVISTTGAAAGISSLTTAIGFGGMIIANNPGLSSIGLMAPVGICVCYLCCVLITGSALWFWKPARAVAPQAPADGQQEGETK